MTTFISNSKGQSESGTVLKTYRINSSVHQAFIFIVSHYFYFERKTKVRKVERDHLFRIVAIW